MNNYDREFDRLVHEYNRWFYAPVRLSVEHPVQTFLEGRRFHDDLLSHDLGYIFREYACFYERDDLTVPQKTAIALGSDCKRLEQRLERGLLDGDIDVIGVRLALQEFYTFVKDIYILDAIENGNVQYPLTGDFKVSQPPGAMVNPS